MLIDRNRFRCLNELYQTPSRPRPPMDPPDSPTASAATSSCAGSRRFFGCYLLVSELSRAHTYVGFTVDPARRLRQHNGLLKGGASRTKRYKPWKMVAVVHGFVSKTQALQFEWSWQNPQKTTALRLHFDTPDALPLPTVRKTFASGRLQVVAALLSVPPWSLSPLTLTVAEPRERWGEYGLQSLTFPTASLRVKFQPVDELSAGLDYYDYRHDVDSVLPRCLPRRTSGCPVCDGPLRGLGEPAATMRKLTHCAHCGALAHIRCMVQCSDEQDENMPDRLIPLYVRCKLCSFRMHWSLVCRLARALESDEG